MVVVETYENNKTGMIFVKLDTVINATSRDDQHGRKMVLYKSLDTDSIFVREETEFYEQFTKSDSDKKDDFFYRTWKG